MQKVDPFFASAAAEEKEGADGQEHTCPLPSVELLVVDEQGAHERHYRPCGVDRADESERQMLDGKITAYPRRQHDHGFSHHKKMVCQRGRRNIPAAIG